MKRPSGDPAERGVAVSFAEGMRRHHAMFAVDVHAAAEGPDTRLVSCGVLSAHPYHEIPCATSDPPVSPVAPQLVEALKEALKDLLENMGGHSHWREGGSGGRCATCERQGEAATRARAALAAVVPETPGTGGAA